MILNWLSSVLTKISAADFYKESGIAGISRCQIHRHFPPSTITFAEESPPVIFCALCLKEYGIQNLKNLVILKSDAENEGIC